MYIMSIMIRILSPHFVTFTYSLYGICIYMAARVYNREGEYPTPVYHSVVALERGNPSLYNLTATWLPNLPEHIITVVVFEQARWEAMDCTNSEV